MTDIVQHAQDIHDQLPADTDVTTDEIVDRLEDEALRHALDATLWEKQQRASQERSPLL